MQIGGSWEYGKKCKSNGRQVIASERLDRKEVTEEYEKNVCEKLREAGWQVKRKQV